MMAKAYNRDGRQVSVYIPDEVSSTMKITIAPSDIKVTIERGTPRPAPAPGDDSLIITATANTNGAVARTQLGAWSVKAKDTKLAARLKAAIEAGAVFATEQPVRVDIYGATYLATEWKTFINGRTMNADLRRLGF